MTFILGARPITSGYDLSFAGRIAAAVFFSRQAHPNFSTCMLDCLESLTVDVTGTSLLATPFSVSSRQLQLLGPASTDEIQLVLRSAVYLNRAPDINVDVIQLEVRGLTS